MKAVLCEELGPPEKLTIRDIDPPVAGDGEVTIEVKATALNFFDTLIIEGKYQYRPDVPFSPGAEIAGVIKSTGSGVTGFHPGDKVMAYLGWGGVREEVVTSASRVVKLPDGITNEAAAGLTVTYGTTLARLEGSRRSAARRNTRRAWCVRWRRPGRHRDRQGHGCTCHRLRLV